MIFFLLRLMIFLLIVSRWLTPWSLSLNGFIWKKTYPLVCSPEIDICCVFVVFDFGLLVAQASIFPSFSACFNILFGIVLKFQRRYSWNCYYRLFSKSIITSLHLPAAGKVRASSFSNRRYNSRIQFAFGRIGGRNIFCIFIIHILR